MKFYETTFEDYIQSFHNYNIHPELNKVIKTIPDDIYKFENTIVYGPPGIGKYTQILSILQKYSPTQLKYEKKIIANTEKQEYKYKISDIHYEVDMSLLGCNSKIIWHEIFSQIVDIVSVNSLKIGFIVCKNFHLIHSELLDIFYSYIQHYNHSQTNIYIKFILVTEHVSFIPNKILNICQILNIGSPSKDKYIQIATKSCSNIDVPYTNQEIVSRINNNHQEKTHNLKKKNINSLINSIDTNGIINIKEVKSFDLLYSNNSQIQELPNDNFNLICNKIIEYIIIEKSINYIDIRDSLYDILTYNLDVIECIWYILCFLIKHDHLEKKDISEICCNIYYYLKYFNNNYRPIYHLESFFIYISIKVNKIDT
mgnify:CR=1 FL=1|tara:strand:+ start:1246 stop:2355 length:1110 start_codon:yes stop_codon:yes gene_type:complete